MTRLQTITSIFHTFKLPLKLCGRMKSLLWIFMLPRRWTVLSFWLCWPPDLYCLVPLSWLSVFESSLTSFWIHFCWRNIIFLSPEVEHGSFYNVEGVPSLIIWQLIMVHWWLFIHGAQGMNLTYSQSLPNNQNSYSCSPEDEQWCWFLTSLQPVFPKFWQL